MQLRPVTWTAILAMLSSSLCDGQLLALISRITIPQFQAGVEFMYKAVGSISNERDSKRLGKLQPLYSSRPFPCDVTIGRSPRRPTSVHALRPGDIDVIGAMGDSLTAGNGALASDIFHVVIPNRGVSFSIGGQEDWRQYLTLANILKVFNPKLIGYSVGDVPTWDRRSHFNVAEPGAMSADIPHQARILVKRMLSDKKVDFKQDWKLVTLMIGPNDFCLNVCYEDINSAVAKHRRELQEALDHLYKTVPRLMVNIVPAPNLQVLIDMVDRPPACFLSITGECPCLFGLPHASTRKLSIQTMDIWQKADIEIGNSPRYRGREDFAIVVQPFSTKITFPTREDPVRRRNTTDYSYLSADCFHFSQKMCALTANTIWNNMLEPVGRKSLDFEYPIFKTFLCPTEKRPYIFTHKNSPGV